MYISLLAVLGTSASGIMWMDGKSCFSLFRLCEGLLLLSVPCGRNMPVFSQLYLSTIWTWFESIASQSHMHGIDISFTTTFQSILHLLHIHTNHLFIPPHQFTHKGVKGAYFHRHLQALIKHSKSKHKGLCLTCRILLITLPSSTTPTLELP